jgi:hypothetical protein
MKIIRTAFALCMLLPTSADDGTPYAQSAPAVSSFDADGLRFGNQVVGEESPPLRLTTANAGAGSLYVNSVEVKGEDWKEFHVVRDTCTGRALASGRSCVVDVRFVPAETGDRAAVLVVNDSAPDGPQKITLTGTGVNSVDVPPFGGD